MANVSKQVPVASLQINPKQRKNKDTGSQNKKSETKSKQQSGLHLRKSSSLAKCEVSPIN